MTALDPMDDAKFWARQLSEHALFLNLGLEVEPYKSQAGALHADWERVRTALESAPDVEAAKTLLSAPVGHLAAFKKAVLDEQRAGKWLGWIYPLFVDHTLRELRYFVARFWHGGLAPGVTLAQNLRFMREHAEFAAHLLDPTQTDLIRAAHASADQFAGVEAACCASLTPGLLDLSTRAGKALDAYLTGNPVSDGARGVIHPVLADHVVREGRRFLATVDELAKGQQR